MPPEQRPGAADACRRARLHANRLYEALLDRHSLTLAASVFQQRAICQVYVGRCARRNL